jgi:hypothetical protein
MSITLKDLMLLSPAGEELAKEKQQEGRQEGRIDMARGDLLYLAEKRFPGLVDPNRIAVLTDLATIRALFDALILAPNRAAAEEAAGNLLGGG